MRSTALRAAALAALVLLAGCAGGLSGAPGPTASDDATEPTATEPDAADGGDAATNGGIVRFYVSDEPNAIDDFRHLNVTITRVGFERANGSWVEYEVDGRTVDLTRLKGDNATLVGTFDVPDGNYTTVFVHVGAVDATLTTGEHVRVKLPSGKLQIQKGFAVVDNESVDFVFDIGVHKAGKSGKYILRPVISQSGAGVPIDDVDDEDDERDEDERGNEDERDDEAKDDKEKDDERGNGDDEPASALNATFVGTVTPGENATIEVTRNGSAVANATVVVNGETVGTTGAGGRLSFAVPADAEELEVEVVAGEAEAELDVEFGDA